MKICLLAPASSVHTQRIASSLAERRLEVTVITFHPAVIPGVAVVPLAAPQVKIGYLAAIPRARRMVAELAPDIIHAHYLSSYGTVGSWCGRRPFIVSVWGSDIFDFPRRNRMNRWLVKHALGRADYILSTSRFMAGEVQRYTEKEVQVTPFGVDALLFRPLPGRKMGKENVIGTVKALETQYGIDTVIRALAELAGSGVGRSMRLEIVGRGSQQGKLRLLAKLLGVDHLVNFTGPVEHRELPRHFNRYTVAAYGSTCQESFGVSLLEAQACGVPVVASDVGGFREVVHDGATGLLVPPGDHRAMAAAIGELLEDRGMRRRFSRAAREFVAAEYPWKKTVDLFMDLYHQMLSSPI